MSEQTIGATASAAGYDLARQALGAMELNRVQPSAVTFGIWLERTTNPEGDLAREIGQLTSSKQMITEDIAERLANKYLPNFTKAAKSVEIGAQLGQAFDEVLTSISSARETNSNYLKSLRDTSARIKSVTGVDSLKELISDIVSATRFTQEENSKLGCQIEASRREIAALKRKLDEVQHESRLDSLTELANRKTFDEEINKACAEADRFGGPLALAMIDIDHFKKFNDTWGHQTGDQVIRYVASVIGRVGSGIAVSARYGGEEFGVIFPSNPLRLVVAELEQARLAIASRSLKRRSTQEELSAVTISIGVAERLKGEGAASLIARADAALYQSKVGGRNRLTIAQPEAQLAETPAPRSKVG